MTLKDLLLTPIYLLIIYLIAYAIRNQIKNKQIRTYFIPALHAKIIGALALGLIYQFYYGGGDTYNFFRDSGIIWQAFLTSPLIGIRILFAGVENYSPDLYEFTRHIYFFSAGDAQTFHVIRLSGFFDIFSFHTYSINAIFFAIASFTGVWAMYKVFYDLFPGLHRPLAIAVFFIPSVFFWGSGLMKDTIAMGALGWLFHAFYFGLIRRKQVVVNLIVLFIALNIIRIIKVYILQAFLPAAFLWLFLQYRASIKSRPLRIISFPFVIALTIPFAYIALIQITVDNERYQLENVISTTQVTSDWLATVSEREGGSGYTLGEISYTPTGLLSIAPRAIWLGLFQPHPWQANNPVMLLSAIEATFFLFLTIKIFFQVNFFKLMNLFFQYPILTFCLIFSLVLAFGVAIASFNFGTMVRYRIPMMPFYLAMLYLIQYLSRDSKKIF
ncbi:MAG: hypothetical protein NW226_00430 [Microscillaceae bacterium]|nr:hypothetical protein [Microscillaceae bacterium]